MNADFPPRKRGREQIISAPIWPKDCWADEHFTKSEVTAEADFFEMWTRVKSSLKRHRDDAPLEYEILVSSGGRLGKGDSIASSEEDEPAEETPNPYLRDRRPWSEQQEEDEEVSAALPKDGDHRLADRLGLGDPRSKSEARDVEGDEAEEEDGEDDSEVRRVEKEVFETKKVVPSPVTPPDPVISSMTAEPSSSLPVKPDDSSSSQSSNSSSYSSEEGLPKAPPEKARPEILAADSQENPAGKQQPVIPEVSPQPVEPAVSPAQAEISAPAESSAKSEGTADAPAETSAAAEPEQSPDSLAADAKMKEIDELRQAADAIGKQLEEALPSSKETEKASEVLMTEIWSFEASAYAAEAETAGFMVIDSGATQSIGSVLALEALAEKLGNTKFEINTAAKTNFRFGNGSVGTSSSEVMLTHQAGGKAVKIRMAALETSAYVPLLASVQFLESLGARLCFVEGTLETYYGTTRLQRASNGHWLLNLAREDLMDTTTARVKP